MMRCGKLQQYRKSIICAAVSAHSANREPASVSGTTPIRSLSFGQRFRRGFTLIELMVVVAIIMVLIALLFPAFERARYMAQNVKCVTDKRSIVQGLILYATDHGSRFPVSTWGGMYMNPHDMSQQIIQTLHVEGNIPYGFWACAVTDPSLEYRNDVKIGPSVQPYNGYNKFYGGNNINYWVEHGGSGVIGGPRPGDSVWSSYVLDQNPGNVIVSDQISCDAAGNVSGGQHLFNGIIANSNVACADGHAESRSRSEIRLRYFYAWNMGY